MNQSLLKKDCKALHALPKIRTYNSLATNGRFASYPFRIGLIKDSDEAAATLKLQDSFLPQQQHQNVCMKLYAIFERLV